MAPVIAAVAEHFGCSTANGLELENQGGLGTALSHTEQRVVMNDYMAGILVPGIPTSFSKMTLSIFEGSGNC